MIKLIVGGARSGKSSFAERQYSGIKDVVYIATARVEDTEMRERVTHHQETRPGQWRTFEGNYKLKDAVGNEGHYLLDCITVLSSNIMYDMTHGADHIGPELQRLVEDKIFGELTSLFNVVYENGYTLILVTNEVGYSLVPEHHIGRVFRDIQGRVNQKVAERADEVHLVCCGIPVRIK